MVNLYGTLHIRDKVNLASTKFTETFLKKSEAFFFKVFSQRTRVTNGIYQSTVVVFLKYTPCIKRDMEKQDSL